MIIVSRTTRAKVIAKKWYNQYNGDSRLGWKYGEDKRVIYENLLALGDNPHPDDVDRIIGNSSWTDCRCSECRKYVECTIMVGEEPDYESETAYLCFPCLEKAYKECFK